jgi:hypothetical protein
MAGVGAGAVVERVLVVQPRGAAADPLLISDPI